MHLNSKEFIERFKKQDKDAFTFVVEELSDRLYNLIFKMVQNKDDAKDILQNTFVKAYKSALSFKGESSLYTYIAAIALNEAREKFRKEKKLLFLDIDLLDQETDPFLDHGEIENEEMFDRVNRALKLLPEAYKEVLVLKDMDEVPVKDIARLLKMSEGGVKTRIHRARMLMKKLLNYEK